MRPLAPSTTCKLFATGFTVGPLVDSLHNQCLLRYTVLPIALSNPLSDDATSFWFCSSWTVPPLLGVAYVVLGGLLPRLFENGLRRLGYTNPELSFGVPPLLALSLSQRAWMAVATTALIFKLSEVLETHPSIMMSRLLESTSLSGPAEAHIFLLFLAAVCQWALLDATGSAFGAAVLVSFGGPLSELPFVAHGVWEYLPAAADYLPLQQLPSWLALEPMLCLLLGDDFRHLALSSITGPCYFAVTMDAIALGRWFDDMSGSEDETLKAI